MKTSPTKYYLIFLFYLFTTDIISQNHRYDRYDGPTDGALGLKCVLIAAVMFGAARILGKLFNVEKKDSGISLGIVIILTVGAIFIGGFGLIMIGF